jgi:outer membrane protein assembly factor BamB
MILMIACAATAFPADWPAFRGNAQRTGYYPGAISIDSIRPLWRETVGCALVSSPVIAGNTLYIGGRDSCIHAYDAGSGTLLWKKQTGGWVDATPLIDGDRLIIGSRDGRMYGMARSTGEIIYTLATGLQLSSPLVCAGKVIAGMGWPEVSIGAWDASLATDTALPLEPAWTIGFTQYSYASPAVLGNKLVTAADNSFLYCMNIDEEGVSWAISTGGGVYLSSPCIDAGDSVIFFAPGNTDPAVYAVDLKDGYVCWRSAGAGVAPLIKQSARREITVTMFQGLLRLTVEDRRKAGERLEAQGWSVPPLVYGPKLAKTTAGADTFFSYGEVKTSSVAIDKKNVYVVQKELGYPMPRFSVLALDKYTGALRWRYSRMAPCVSMGYCSSPVVTDRHAFAGMGQGHFVALSSADGSVAWQDSLDGDILSSPAITSGRLFAATFAGSIYAWQMQEAAPFAGTFMDSSYCYPNPARGAVSHIRIVTASAGELTITIYTMAEKPATFLSRRMAA